MLLQHVAGLGLLVVTLLAGLRLRDRVVATNKNQRANGLVTALTSAVADAIRIPVIASGGVGTLDHLVDGVRQGHATAVLAASIFHFGEFTIADAKAHMAAAGIPVQTGYVWHW